MITLLHRAHLCLGFALILPACSIDDATDEDDLVERGVGIGSALPNATGLGFGDGLDLANGVSMANGLTVGTGLSVAHGLATVAGLSPAVGLMQTQAGQRLVKSIVECALPTTQSIQKADPVQGGIRTFKGLLGLAPAWRIGKCDASCQQIVSACLLARANELGEPVKVDMRSPHPALGVTASGSQYAVQEGAFYGNLFQNPPKAHACKGVDGTFGVFEGRTCGDGAACAIEGIEDHCKESCLQTAGKTFGACVEGNFTYSQVITTYLDPTPWSEGCPPGCDACDAGVCAFLCTPDEPCGGEILDCPMGWDCEVVCNGADTCKSTKIDCTGASECAITCVDGQACMSAQVDCGVGDCNLACDGAESCKNTKLKVTGGGDGTMTCAGPSSGELCGDVGSGTCSKIGC
jgi:hypothetical protein